MHIDRLDLNLLRLLVAIERTGSVGKAAQLLDIAQPVASQGLARLRRSLGDALFVRAGSGVQPTPFTERLMPAVRTALDTLEQALVERERFDAARSSRVFGLHISDIGETRVLPALMARLRQQAPDVRVESYSLPAEQLAAALDTGRIDLAFGVLPQLQGMPSECLLSDRYRLVTRRGHPLAERGQSGGDRGGDGDGDGDGDGGGRKCRGIRALAGSHFVAVRTHARTTELLRRMGLEGRLRLRVQHFIALPEIVRASDLVAIVPEAILRLFPSEEFAVMEVPVPTDAYDVSMYWGWRFDVEPANRWFRALVRQCIVEANSA